MYVELAFNWKNYPFLFIIRFIYVLEEWLLHNNKKIVFLDNQVPSIKKKNVVIGKWLSSKLGHVDIRFEKKKVPTVPRLPVIVLVQMFINIGHRTVLKGNLHDPTKTMTNVYINSFQQDSLFNVKLDLFL